MKKLWPALFFLLTSFHPVEDETSTVRIHILSEPDMLNPINYTSAESGYIINTIFQPLVSIDFNTLKVVPVLAENRPVIEKTANGGLRITYTIRKEARWD